MRLAGITFPGKGLSVSGSTIAFESPEKSPSSMRAWIVGEL